ncbi:Bifunctional protein PutA [Rubripirellula lacrimiformis]|uniref:L-glutamate gamma-semialdehyde dehydrogenase n=1 Tax=Rubripirellula lacrimiformis TaxID=1930273 RepID=A0A517N5W9_9BACT|nr:proline dehydrogenase family protein [Rubripirellula lacrimiformis]QDT02539.1 Bifunctional protein PutA [Rubripirellula lacrimiformis]
MLLNDGDGGQIDANRDADDGSDRSDVDRAIQLAADLLERAAELQTPQERRQQAELDRMVKHQTDKATMVEMTDQAFRTYSPARVADQLTHLLDVQGIPRFFSPVEQAMLRGFQSFGEYLPGVAVPLVKEKMRRETANVILPAEPELLTQHLRNRQSHGVGMNVNLLGEAVLGEDEVRNRMRRYTEALRLDDVRCMSVKISTMDSQVSSLARQHTIDKVSDRLETLYRTADREIDPSTGNSKFIYLDMEEYRDLYLTADVLCQTLDRPGLEQTRAGIALQAYVPDSYPVMQRLIEWSTKRVADGCTGLTIRLVKGANLEMERVESSIGGHRQSPYMSKVETDANYKRMLRDLVAAARSGIVHIGLASHNLFDVALGLIWAGDLVHTDAIQIEMLEGMANHQRRAIGDHVENLLLYAPACRQDEFLNAIGYLIRRLDENTGPQNFLRHSYRLKPGSPEFKRLADDFRQSYAMIDSVSSAPRRNVERKDAPEQPPVAEHWSLYVNEPDTDWSVPANSVWAEQTLQKWKDQCGDQATVVPLWVGDQQVTPEPDQMRESTDPSRPGCVVCRYPMASLDQVQQAVSIAASDSNPWKDTSLEHRHEVLRGAAQRMRQRRGDMIGAMVAEGGKTIPEADPEISEAIDFCEFYPLTVNHWAQQAGVDICSRGVVAVITPWNFPLAIPAGGIAAALACGNTVILKPASETVWVAAMVCDAFWDAGVPRDALQMLPCEDEVAESGLVKDGRVETVILTGGTSTAKRMLAVRPDLHLLAETGGKNATIVTAMADRDLAVKHVVQSAFGHAGQKCSATSLLLLEQEVFDDPKFQSLLADAVESLPVGSAWDLETKMGPLIAPPGKTLTRGMKTLEDDETWLVAPEHIVGQPNLYRPGVKWNVAPGSFSHLTELFGPVLGVMPFSRLEEAIEIVRSTGYGLTSGLESLDDREIELWKQSIHAGNLYINRSTTGAIVLRQPFGGVGLSAYGPGVKAGGPHYVLALMRITDSGQTTPSTDSVSTTVAPSTLGSKPTDALTRWVGELSGTGIDDELRRSLMQMVDECSRAMQVEFSGSHDTVRLLGQDNLRRYLSVKGLTIRVEAGDSQSDLLSAVIAAVSVQTPVTLSIDPKVPDEWIEWLDAAADAVPGLVDPIDETDSDLADRIAAGDVTRLRRLTPSVPGSGSLAACCEHFVTVISEPVLSCAAIECLRYLDEQSISHDYHRYGNLGRRANQQRRPVE